MDEWSQSVDRLLLKHYWLLLFSLPKLLKLSTLLRRAFQTDDGAMEVMQEISFLFCSDMKSREKVLDAIKVVVRPLDCIWQIVFYCFILSFCRTHRAHYKSINLIIKLKQALCLECVELF